MTVHAAGSVAARQALSLCWGSVGVLGASAVAVAASASDDELPAANSSSRPWWRHLQQHRCSPPATAVCEPSGAFVGSSSPKIPANLRQRMTLIGRFSLESESPVNPSITSFFMALSGDPLTPSSLIRLWHERQMSERHPRFLQTVSSIRPGYFEPSQKPLERYITEALYPPRGGNSTQDVRDDLRRRIQGMQTSPWNLGDALWHLYVAPWSEPLRPAFPSLASTSLSFSTPVSSLHGDVTKENAEGEKNKLSYVFFRAHHALADGASFVAAMMDLFDEAEEFRAHTAAVVRKHKKRARTWLERLKCHFLRLLWFLKGSAIGIWYQSRLLVLSYLEPNPWEVIRKHHMASSIPSHPSQSTHSPSSSTSAAVASRVSTATVPAAKIDRAVSFVDGAAPVDQVKWVARTVAGPKATVNDVFVSCITAALARQLQYHRNRILENMTNASSSTSLSSSSSSQREDDRVKKEATFVIAPQAHVNISVPVHLSGGVILPGESLGNRLGAFVVRLPGEAELQPSSSSSSSSEDRLREVHHELRRMKQTSTPILSHLMAKGLSLAAHVLPSSWISYLYGRSHAGSTAVVTNVRGPPSAIHLGGRKVESFHGFVPLPPGVPMGVVVSSYDRKMTLTLTAEPWAVPDPDQFLGWVLDEYLRLLAAAVRLDQSRSALET